MGNKQKITNQSCQGYHDMRCFMRGLLLVLTVQPWIALQIRKFLFPRSWCFLCTILEIPDWKEIFWAILGSKFTPSSFEVTVMVGVFWFWTDFKETVAASPAMDAGLCFFFLLMLTSTDGSILCCQHVTLARKPLGCSATEFSEFAGSMGEKLVDFLRRIVVLVLEDFVSFLSDCSVFFISFGIEGRR